jgi:Fe-S cluster biogenesis protein NfuA
MGILDGHRAQRGAAIAARIRNALAELRPMLRIEASAVELIDYDERAGVALLRVDGGCPDCEMTAAMLIEGIEAHLRLRVPEIREVRTDLTASDSHG